MSWCRAVWLEGSKEYKQTIPSKWVKEKERLVLWPVGVNPLTTASERRDPQSTWKIFKLVKTKSWDGTFV